MPHHDYSSRVDLAMDLRPQPELVPQVSLVGHFAGMRGVDYLDTIVGVLSEDLDEQCIPPGGRRHRHHLERAILVPVDFYTPVLVPAPMIVGYPLAAPPFRQRHPPPGVGLNRTNEVGGPGGQSECSGDGLPAGPSAIAVDEHDSLLDIDVIPFFSFQAHKS